MSRIIRGKVTLIGTLAAVVVLMALWHLGMHAQSKAPINPPYRIIADWPQVPSNVKLGAVPGIHIGPDGNIYAFHRCGADSCIGSNQPTILKFDRAGKLLTSWGAGMFNFPHGMDIDRDGFVWVTDAAGLSAEERTENGKGHQVFKFSPDGQLLMTLGKAGIGGNSPDTFFSPSDVAVAPNGDIFVTDGHSCNDRNAASCTSRVVRYSKDGKFIKAFGKTGSQPGEFRGPHCLAIDSQQRVIVCDRNNGRLQVFDPEGRFLAQWTGWGKPTGIFIARDDTMYVADSLANVVQGKVDPALVSMATGIYVGSAKDGAVKWFIPDEFAGPEDLTVDALGDMYVGESRPQTIRKFVLDPDRLLLGDPELRQTTTGKQ